MIRMGEIGRRAFELWCLRGIMQVGFLERGTGEGRGGEGRREDGGGRDEVIMKMSTMGNHGNRSTINQS